MSSRARGCESWFRNDQEHVLLTESYVRLTEARPQHLRALMRAESEPRRSPYVGHSSPAVATQDTLLTRLRPTTADYDGNPFGHWHVRSTGPSDGEVDEALMLQEPSDVLTPRQEEATIPVLGGKTEVRRLK
ncbi:hypothetical protein NUW54_g6455 [Trametes sanguinea]|uniref:Uncharacterized protein n=1 Tax=Trametes sanguinea TaxID=158606 RepID=A0ACC1PSQ0_9APHY|nr:hypothetical protein NUW54_g6455 [Trametes sanguinea]